MSIKNIIFDLGGVIIDLGFDEMSQAFSELGIKDFENYFNPLQQQKFFEQLELGNISEQTFYKEFRKHISPELTDNQIKNTWNLIIKPFNPERMALLEKLTSNYNLYLFSNTNEIHAKYFEAQCLKQTGKSLQHYFIKTYYSHDLHLRKPDPKAFIEVLQQAHIEAKETVFIDDNAENIIGAKKVALNTIHLQNPSTILDIDFAKLKNQ
ncbi:HAD family hydrolase [Lactococcus nasutitermitis]|uniref:HAD family hydrolase n=1 Tax=Lactococcus nasutitermitis TaxID=1652957 RepID=A0ABV9JCD2_9LACT|nr:HAD family phosphatase [Lactococcus nasutitermitis]